MHIWQSCFVRCSAVLGAIVFVGAVVGRCEGQTAQRVQLPTFGRFGVSTTVLVPDRGSLFLGGVGRASRGGSSFGLPFGGRGFGNRGFARGVSAGGVSVSATIIDHRELDRAVLAEAARLRGAKFDVLGRPVSSVPTKGFSSASIHDRVVASRKNALESGGSRKYVRLGRQAEADGDFRSAIVFYEMAVERGSHR